jgi:hypothetical protein
MKWRRAAFLSRVSGLLNLAVSFRARYDAEDNVLVASAMIESHLALNRRSRDANKSLLSTSVP